MSNTIITILEQDVKDGWAWIQNEAVAVYDTVHAIVGLAIAAFEATVIQDLWGAAATLVKKLVGQLNAPTNLGDLETAFLNTLSSLGGQLLAAAAQLGSTALQSILGLIQLKAHPPVAAA